MMTELKLHTYGEKLIVSEKVTIASGDINSAAIVVEFDECWDNYPARTAIFKNDKVTGNIEVLMVDNKCTIPAEVLQKNGTLKISIRAASIDGAALKTSTKIRYTIAEGASPGTTTLTPTMDLYQQYLKAMNEKAEPLFDAYKKQMDAEHEANMAAMEIEHARFKAEFLKLLEPTVLWENPDPLNTKSFNTTKDNTDNTVVIEGDFSGFKYYTVVFTVEVKDGESTKGNMCSPFVEKGVEQTCYWREFSAQRTIRKSFVVNDNDVTFTVFDTTGVVSEGSCLIPYQILGFAPIVEY